LLALLPIIPKKCGREGHFLKHPVKFTEMSWEASPSSPKCRTTHTVVDRTRGPRPYPDEGWPWKDIPSSATYEIVKIRGELPWTFGNCRTKRRSTVRDGVSISPTLL
jgi:hypothetical protein